MYSFALFRRTFVGSYFRAMPSPSQQATHYVNSSRNKTQMAQRDKVFGHDELESRSKTPGGSRAVESGRFIGRWGGQVDQ